jgi:hypothetical protein
MRKLALGLIAGSILATGARADLPITFPQQAVTSAMTDTLDGSVKGLTGVTGYHNPADASTYTTYLTTEGAVGIKYNIKMASGGAAYSATAGILVPITSDWQIKDLSAATAITFWAKSSAANTIHLIIGSDSYDAVTAKANAALTSSDLKITTAWKQYTIDITDLTMSAWYSDCAGDCLATGWTGTTINIGAAVKHFNFQPQLDGGWNTDGSQLTSKSTGDFYIRDINIVGASKYIVPAGKNCASATKSFRLDQFDNAKKSTLSREGNYWYVFSDTSSDDAKLNDTATGMSQIVLPTGAKKWTPDGTANVAWLTANLDKNVPTSTFKYHAYAGWATIGVGLGRGDGYKPLNLSSTGFNAISFDLYVGKDAAGSLAAGSAFDSVKVPVINFKVGKSNVGDAETYYVPVPVSASNGTKICIDLSALQQPSWYVKNNLGGNANAFEADSLTKLGWEMKIEDQKTVATSGPNTFGITNVTFYGVDSTDVAQQECDPATDPNACVDAIAPRAGFASFHASYNNGLVLTYSVKGASAQIDVVHMDGSRAASFKGAAVANSMSFPVKLQSGSYMVIVRGESGNRMVAPLAVTR